METVFKISLRPSLNYSTFQQFTAVQGDKNTRQIQAEILNDDGTAFIPESGVVAEYWSQKPDGNGTSHSASISGNIVTVELNEQDLAVAGKVYASIVFKKDNEILTAMPFYFRVIAAPLGRDIESANDYLTMVAATEAAEAATEEAITAAHRFPLINPTNQHWMLWDSDEEEYIDSGVVAEGHSPYINQSNHHWMIWNTQTEVFVDSGIVSEGHSPYINNSNNHWMVWDTQTETYVDTGISASGTDGVVMYGSAQTLTDAQKGVARSNIGAESAADVGALANLTTTTKSSIVNAINEVDQHADEGMSRAYSLEGNFSLRYSDEATYAVGDYCVDGYVLYKCNTAITTPEAWNPNHWTQTTMDAELNGIGFKNIMVLELTGITSLPATFSISGMTADHELIQKGYAQITPRSSAEDVWTLISSTNSLQVRGTFSGSTSTTIIATMGIPLNKVTAVAQ